MDVNACWGSVTPTMLRGVRDTLGILVRLSPAQITAYVDMPGREQLEQFTVMGFPCFVDPTMEQDRIEIDIGGQVVARIINLAVPSLYSPK